MTEAAQLYDTVIADRVSGNSFRFLTVPREALEDQGLLDDSGRLFAALGVSPLPATIPTWRMPWVIWLALTHDSAEGVRAVLSDPHVVPAPDWPRPEDAVGQFALYLAFAPVVPVEGSPLKKKSLGEALTGALWIANLVVFGAGAAHAAPAVIVVAGVGGLILGIPMVEAARGLGDGLRDRLHDLVSPKHRR